MAKTIDLSSTMLIVTAVATQLFILTPPAHNKLHSCHRFTGIRMDPVCEFGNFHHAHRGYHMTNLLKSRSLKGAAQHHFSAPQWYGFPER